MQDLVRTPTKSNPQLNHTIPVATPDFIVRNGKNIVGSASSDQKLRPSRDFMSSIRWDKFHSIMSPNSSIFTLNPKDLLHDQSIQEDSVMGVPETPERVETVSEISDILGPIENSVLHSERPVNEASSGLIDKEIWYDPQDNIATLPLKPKVLQLSNSPPNQTVKSKPLYNTLEAIDTIENIAMTTPIRVNRQEFGDEWKSAFTSDGKVYYYNRRTREAVWTLPDSITTVRTAPDVCRYFQQRGDDDDDDDVYYCPLCGISFNASDVTRHVTDCNKGKRLRVIIALLQAGDDGDDDDRSSVIKKKKKSVAPKKKIKKKPAT